MRKLTAAHPNLPFGTLVQVTNLDNGKQVVVRVNDRGPFGRRRVIDLSYAAARELDMVGPGTAQVELALLGRYDPMTMPPVQTVQPTLLAAAQAPAAVPQNGKDPDTATAPGMETADVRDSAARDSAARDAAEASSAVPAAPAAPASPTTPRNLRTRGAALYYTVQVGAFGEVERAAALQQDLARRYPEAAVQSDGIWHRVQVGLFDDREQAEQLRRELAAAGLAALVVAAR
jgi:rare lipoprotein A